MKEGRDGGKDGGREGDGMEGEGVKRDYFFPTIGRGRFLSDPDEILSLGSKF